LFTLKGISMTGPDQAVPARHPRGWYSDAAAVAVYAAGVIIWIAQPDWLTRGPLEPVILPSLAVAAAFGAVSGNRRALAAPLMFGALVGVISAATTSGDLGRTGELALGILAGLLLAGATALGILIRHHALKRTGR
jgi:hypothetical protein